MRDSATRLYTRAGEIIRIHVPINFTDWRLVPDNFKDDVWEALLGDSLTHDQKTNNLW